jgi:hypothetical protein
MQFTTKDENIYVQFPSKSKWNKKLATMYRIFHRLSPNLPYQEYEGEPIVVHNARPLLYLKFAFPNMKTMRLQEQQMELDFSRLVEDH